MSPNGQKLLRVLEEILLIDETQYRDDQGHDGISVAVEPGFAAKLGIESPPEVALLEQAILGAFGAWDSLATTDIAEALQKHFGYEMSPEQMAMLECIGDIKDALRSGGVDI